MRTQKALAIAPLFLPICVCIVLALIAYRLHTKYNKEEDFFAENREMFRTIVTLAETAKVRDWGCRDLSLPSQIQTQTGDDTILVCYAAESKVAYIVAFSPLTGAQFCYIADAQGLPSGFRIGNGWIGDPVRRLEDDWFLCNLSID